jgi:predicted  nucleic acid-binding Zn-ribbon protein
MTNLEAISLKLEEERKAKLESILMISGSESIAKNEYGVTLVKDSNVASSLVFKTLNKPKYDESELIKAVDTEVKELKPDIPAINRNLVPKPIYDEEVATNADLRKQVTDLTTQVDTLTNTINDLTTQLQSEINQRLNIEQTNDVVVNQLDTLGGTVTDITGQIATSLQKSVDESILRAALQSQNAGFKAQINALIKQIDSLNAIIKGLQSQLGAVQQQQAIQQSTVNTAAASGGDVINKVVVLTFGGSKEDNSVKLHGKLNPKNGDTKFIAGGEMRFVNNDTQPVNIEIVAPKPSATRNQWLGLPKSTFQLAAGADETIKLSINQNGGDGVESAYHGWLSGWGHSQSYDSTITISVTRNDGSKDSKTYPTRFTKNHPGSF